MSGAWRQHDSTAAAKSAEKSWAQSEFFGARGHRPDDRFKPHGSHGLGDV